MFQRAAEQINAGEFLENFGLFLLRRHFLYVKMLDYTRQDRLWTRFHRSILKNHVPIVPSSPLLHPEHCYLFFFSLFRDEKNFRV